MRRAAGSVALKVGVLFLGLAFGPGAVAQTTANLTSPANNSIFALPATVTLKAGATATAPATIMRVEFYANGSLIGADTTKAFSFTWTNPAPGAYTLTAIAFDSVGGQATSNARSITVNASNQPPTVSLTAPANNSRFALPATVTLKANATPPETNDTLARVDFLANGAVIGSDTSKAFTFTWTPTPGTYTLTAVATDGQGAQATSSARTITVAPNQPPTVNLTAPANNSTYAPPASIALKAGATPPEDNDTVARVDFFANGSLIGSDTSKAYAFTWTSPPAGTYTLTAVATDGQGAQTTSNVRTVTVESANLPPTVSLTSPANNAVFSSPGSVTLKANATPPEDNDTVARVDFFANGTLIGTDTTKAYSLTWTNPTPGTYTLTAVATDGLGAQTTSNSRAITVNTAANVPPTVSLTSPADGASFTAPATINLTATAADADGTVARVDFFQGTTPIGTATSAPYIFSWTNVAQGTYAITAVATDNGGAMTTSIAVNVIVNAAVTQMYYIVPDHLNTPRYIADQGGNAVWRWDQREPFGNNVPNDDPNGTGNHFEFNPRFPGQYFDRETSLTYNYSRDFDPTLGRYVESDRIGLRGGLNLYAYVDGNPLVYADPLGRELTLAGLLGFLLSPDTRPNPDPGNPKPPFPAPGPACGSQCAQTYNDGVKKCTKECPVPLVAATLCEFAWRFWLVNCSADCVRKNISDSQ